jgi:hypothetical protein
MYVCKRLYGICHGYDKSATAAPTCVVDAVESMIVRGAQ